MTTHGPFDHHFDAGPGHRAPVRRTPLVRALRRGLAPAAIAALALALGLSGKAHATQPKKGFEPTLPVPPAPPPTDGAIFNANAGYVNLVNGARAHAVGDVLTIVLVENLSTSKQAQGKIAKNGNFSVTPPTAGPIVLNPNALSAGGVTAFSGQGNASETSQLGGEISVTIAEERRNGTVLVKGQKRLLLSQGEEWVQVSGIVRVADIDQNNTIQSGQIADARVIYTGNGSMGRASREGWLSKIFGIINPF